MMKIIFAAVFLFCLQNITASTFVGNGGNAGDVELQVTIAQISNTLSRVTELTDDEKEKLCQCEQILSEHKVCESLKNISERQSYFCADMTAEKAKDILKLIDNGPELSGGVQFLWTSKSMEVTEKNGDRQADAIANAKTKKIVLNRDQFLKLKDYERIYLITHELGHLVQIEKKYLSDDQPIGPFKQDDGARQLLNSMAAAVTMKALTTGQVSDFAKILSTSKNYKTNWFTLGLGTEKKRDEDSRLAIQKYSGWDFTYRHQLNQDWGVSLGARRLTGEEHFFTTTTATTLLNLMNAQVNYRFFPSSNPLTVAGQSHFVVGLGLESGRAEYKIKDDFTEDNDQANLLSPILSAQYYLAMNSGVWFNGGVTYTNHKYTFNNIGFGGYKSDPNQFYINIGASYGF